MKRATCISVCLSLFVTACPSFADVHTWVGGNSNGGGWDTPSNWTNEQGVAECPEAGDTALFNKWNETVVANEADFARLSSLKDVWINSWSWPMERGQELVLDFTADHVLACRIHGMGKLIINGSNRLEFAPSESGGTKLTNFYAPYHVNIGGIEVKDSATLILAQTGFDNVNGFTYGPMTIAADATVIVASNLNYTVLETLHGTGTVRRDIGTSNDKWIQIGWAGNFSTKRAEFSGKITGVANVINYSNQALTGTESDISGYFYSCTGYGRTHMDRGWTYVASIGRKSQPSSIGAGTWVLLGYGGNLGYIGEGETSNRDFTFEGRAQNGLHPQYIDGGPHGGLTLTGTLRCDSYGGEYNQRSVVFCGSNAAPCAVSGPYKMDFGKDGTNYHFYTRKEGPGVWEFKSNASSTYGGVFDIREGTLRFDSMAEVGMNCALGKATCLTREYTGKYKSEYDSIYAIRLGATNLVGAADAVLEFDGAASCGSTTRPLLLTGNGHLRASGAAGAALTFGGISATAGEKTLVIDGTNTSANTLMDVSDGDGVVSVVKEGTGTWMLEGSHTFSGDLAVKKGTLKIRGDNVFRYFRVTFWDDVFNHPNGCYVNEFGMYAADGTRVNSGLVYNLPAGASWGTSYTIASGAALRLAPGEIAMDHIPGVTSAGFYYYDKKAPDKLCDGADSSMQFVNTLYRNKYAVVMRLADDSKEVAYVDFIQNEGHYQNPKDEYGNLKYQTASAFRVEGSADGMVWTELVVTNRLAVFGTKIVGGEEVPSIVPRDGKWFFSASNKTISDASGDRTLGDGEGLALTARAMIRSDTSAMLKNVRSVSVAAGATFEVDGSLPESLTLSRIKIDGMSGAGTIRGVDFAPNMVVDVTGVPAGAKSVDVPVDFTGVTNFDDVASWTFLKDGEPTTRYTFELTKTGLKLDAAGLMLIVK